VKLPALKFVTRILFFGVFSVQGCLWAQTADTWSFAVSGDSRNCGDIVMPGIAVGVRADGAKFYWHLGDFRANYDFDQDLLASPEYRGKHLAISDYQRIAWTDFISQQVNPFADTPVYLAIGNHELVPPKTRADFLQQFADWLDAPTLRAQRLRDDPQDHALRTYYHWIHGGVDFISLDNASGDQFDEAQLAWIERALARDESDASIRTVVLGMHDALPDSISTGHGMNESAQMERSGRRVYEDLLAFRSKTRKYVYVLASHSHFYLEDVFQGSGLPGWIVGTAGAVRYKLPDNVEPGPGAQPDVYGYLMGTVHQNGEIKFSFNQLKESDIPAEVNNRYPSGFPHWCFAHNSEHLDPLRKETTNRCTDPEPIPAPSPSATTPKAKK